MRRTLSLFSSAAALLLAACGQEIVVVCDDASHQDAQNGGQDAGPNPNPDATPTDTGPNGDGGPNPNDTGVDPPDGGPGDGGAMGCTGSTYCIRALSVSTAKANVREAITFTPDIENPGGATLTFTAASADVTGTRRAGLPEVRMADVTVVVGAGADGVVTFSVADVPPWFTTTTFHVTLKARASGGPEVSATASVEVRGNVLFSGYDSVYAVASDGRPARSIDLTTGRLLQGSSIINAPKHMVLARDGTLVVFDSGATPERLRRFELSAENAHLGDFATMDEAMMPAVFQDHDGTGLVQLLDGRFVLAVYDYNRTPDSALVLWNEDGTYNRTIQALNPSVRWQGIGASATANEILLIERATRGRLVRIDPDSGNELGVIATDIDSGWSVLGMPNGNTYVGIDGAILRVTPQGGKTQVSMLMGGSLDYWYALAPFSDGRILAVRDYSSDSSNIVIIDGTVATGNLRPSMVGGASTTPTGVVYLE